jgi:hypothetical protein
VPGKELNFMYYRLFMKFVLICYIVFFVSITTYAFSETLGKPESTHHDSLSDLHTRIIDNRIEIIALINKGEYKQTIPMLINAVKSYRDSWSANTLGNLYLAGLGVKQNQELAFYWFSIAAKLGSMPAQRQLVNAYLNGKGVNPNPSEAAYLFRKYLAPLQWAGAYCGVFETFSHGFFVHNSIKSNYYYKKCVTDFHTLIHNNNHEISKEIKYSLQYYDH